MWLLAAAVAALGYALRGGCSLRARCLCGVLASALLYGVWGTQAKLMPSRDTESLVSEVCKVPLEQVALKVDDNEADMAAKAREGMSKGIRKWLHRAKVKFGSMEDTPADRRVLELWLGDEMKKDDMRDWDIVKMRPLVVEFMFIPGLEDIVAKQVRESMSKKALKRLMDTRPT